MTRPVDLQRLLAEEPFVRALAASLCAADADDVVQQAWLRAIETRPGALARPRQWLARIVRNLATDARRRQRRRDARHAAAHELAARDASVPSSADLLEVEEARRELVAAVDALPEIQRTAVLLRWYEGLPPRRIAARLGVPAATIRNRLHEALQSLRRRLDERHRGDRRAWLLPLVPLTTSPCALPWRELAGAATTTTLGAIVTTTKTKVEAALAAVLVLATLWFAWPRLGGAIEPPPPAPEPPAVAHGALPTEPDRPAAVAAAPPRESAVVPAPVAAPSMGTLLVHVRHERGDVPATGLDVTLCSADGDFRLDARVAVTGADGTARFDSVVPGDYRALAAINPDYPRRAEVVAGTTSECTIVLRRTFALRGVVVDGAGVPVGGATVEACVGHEHQVDAAPIAVTAADGTFAARYGGIFVLVGARAPGFAASQLYACVDAKDQDVRIELKAPGGCVDGVVVGPDGAPVAGAIVRVGNGRTASVPATPNGGAPLPAQVRTDADGRFRAVGVPIGSQPVAARAGGLAPWSGTCEIGAGLTAAVRIAMTDGVTCTGVVRGDAGQSVAGATVAVGTQGDFVLVPTRSANDGTFALRGLPAGEVVVAATHPDFGKGSARVHGAAGDTVRCTITVSMRGALRGRVLDEAGAPIEWGVVECHAEGDGVRWRGSARTVGGGRFTVQNCPPGRLLTVDVAAPGSRALRREHVDPAAGELVLRLERDTAPPARIVGRVLLPDGRGAVGATIDAFCPEPQQRAGVAVVDPAGTFTVAVPAGAWSLRVVAKDHAAIALTPSELQPGAEWNVGTLQLTRGGTLVVHDGDAKLSYLVMDSNGRFVCGVSSPVPPMRSELLGPGAYRLLARGDGVAAQGLPFTIRDGEETSLTVKARAGVRQRVEFVPASAPSRGVEFEVRRDGELVLVHNASLPSLACDVWLAPGRYTLSTRERTPARTTQLTVGEQEGSPLQVALR
jgi:RNA polymerase sigma-70 factor (ECF subfamily)